MVDTVREPLRRKEGPSRCVGSLRSLLCFWGTRVVAACSEEEGWEQHGCTVDMVVCSHEGKQEGKKAAEFFLPRATEPCRPCDHVVLEPLEELLLERTEASEVPREGKDHSGGGDGSTVTRSTWSVAFPGRKREKLLLLSFSFVRLQDHVDRAIMFSGKPLSSSLEEPGFPEREERTPGRRRSSNDHMVQKLELEDL
jgi:hypothetical protein